ncbi:MAG TPA: amino acid permease [Actinomycetota bacterium]|nr:amino acid permease [Actinomycetota bacterium]
MSRMDVVDGAAAPGAPLKREMGLPSATALVVGNMIGSGIFLLPASLAAVALVSGSGSLLAWALTGLGAMLLAAVFATLGRAYPRTGGPYAFAHKAFGDMMGFLTAWGYWIAAWAGNAAIAIAFTGYLTVFWPSLGESNLAMAGVTIGLVWLLTLVNILGVRESAAVQLVTTVLKFVPLALIGVVGLFFMNTGNFTPFAPNGLGTGEGMWGGITAAAALTLWAFIGLESATVPAEEVKDPERTIPRATILGTLVTTLVYIVATVAIIGVLPLSRLAESTSPFAAAAGEMFGGAWGKAIAAVALVSTFGCLNGWILIQGRVPFAAARDGLFPARFANVHGRTGTPVFGLVVSSLLITALVVMNYNRSLIDQFTFVILLATLTTVVPYAFAAAAEVTLFVVDRERFAGRHVVRSTIVAALGFAYAIFAIWGMGWDIIGKGFLLLMVGVPVFVYLVWRNRTPRPISVRELPPLRVAEPERPVGVATNGSRAAGEGR